MFERHNVVMVQTSVDLNLTHQLLLGATLGQTGLLNNFSRGNTFVLEVIELVALRESSLTQKLALEVLPDEDLAVELDHTLFDHVGDFLSIFALSGARFHSHFFSCCL